MYQQDFNRLKATLLNNIASSFFNEGYVDQADKFNDMALMEDPDYGRAHYRKCLILEQRGEYSQATALAEYAVSTYSNEYESDQGNVKMVPKFEELIENLEGRLPLEQKDKLQKLQEDVEEQLERTMGPMFDLQGELEKVEELAAAARNESLEKETAAST